MPCSCGPKRYGKRKRFNRFGWQGQRTIPAPHMRGSEIMKMKRRKGPRSWSLWPRACRSVGMSQETIPGHRASSGCHKGSKPVDVAKPCDPSSSSGIENITFIWHLTLLRFLFSINELRRDVARAFCFPLAHRASSGCCGNRWKVEVVAICAPLIWISAADCLFLQKLPPSMAAPGMIRLIGIVSGLRLPCGK